MSLYFYRNRKDIPSNFMYVLNNEEFFAPAVIPDNNTARMILREVENAEYVNPTFFKSLTYNLSVVPKDFLSTGVKTFLNILCNPNMCFDIRECGSNVITHILHLTQGYVCYEDAPVQYYGKLKDCDIVYLGEHFTKMNDFLEVINGYDSEADKCDPYP